MKIEDIKFTRVKNEYGQTEYVFEGTKHLPKATIRKHYEYNIYDFKTKRMFNTRHVYLKTLKDVKAWIAQYDDNRERELYEERKEHVLAKLAYRNKKRQMKTLHQEFRRTFDINKEFKEGDMIQYFKPSLNKNCTIAEYLYELCIEKDYQVVPRAKIIKLVELNETEYDEFLDSLMDRHEFLTTQGGCESDDPRLDNVDRFYNLTKEQRDIFLNTMYENVHLITCKNRRSVVVNTEGYEYARYCGFLEM